MRSYSRQVSSIFVTIHFQTRIKIVLVVLPLYGLHSFSLALLSCLVNVCAVLGEHLQRSQPAGHSSLVLNVYWHNIDTLRSQFLVCGWKVLLECHTKWGVGPYPPCTSFPSAFRGMDVYYCVCWVLSVLFLFHCLTVFVFFLPTLNCTRQDILFWNGKTRSALIK